MSPSTVAHAFNLETDLYAFQASYGDTKRQSLRKKILHTYDYIYMTFLKRENNGNDGKQKKRTRG